MKEISATEAARQFSAVLDAVEHDGQTFIVTRAGRGIARIDPASGASGAMVKALLGRHTPDPTWSDDLREQRSTTPAQDRTWPA